MKNIIYYSCQIKNEFLPLSQRPDMKIFEWKKINEERKGVARGMRVWNIWRWNPRGPARHKSSSIRLKFRKLNIFIFIYVHYILNLVVSTRVYITSRFLVCSLIYIHSNPNFILFIALISQFDSRDTLSNYWHLLYDIDSIFRTFLPTLYFIGNNLCTVEICAIIFLR